jgi:hypothetical protein
MTESGSQSRPTCEPVSTTHPLDGLTSLLPRAEVTTAHADLIGTNPYVDTVVFRIDGAQQLVQRGETADSWLDRTVTSIVVTTIPDDALEEWFPAREVETARQFDADYLVPCDKPVYNTHPPSVRRETIQRYVRDLTDVTMALRDDPTSVIPLMKGVTESERRICYRTFDDLGFDRAAFYAAQYFLYGNHSTDLIHRVSEIVAESELRAFMLIGLQAGRYLKEMPPEVTAATGLRWISQSSLRNKTLSMNQKHTRYGVWKHRIETVLTGRQTVLRRWSTLIPIYRNTAISRTSRPVS